MRVPWCLWPFGRRSKRRRERSKRKSTRKGTFPEREKPPARTTDGERWHMFDLYEQGLGTHAIANKTGRSTHTVHSVLTQRGTRPLPNETRSPTMKSLLVVPVAMAGEEDVDNERTPGRVTGARI